MALSTTEVVLVLLLGVALVIAIWVYIDSNRETSSISSQPYARGANLSKPGNVLLTCDTGSVISMDNANMVCHDPDTKNFENPSTDPFLKNGQFDPKTTADLLSDMQGKCDKKQQCTYTFGGIANNFVCGTNGTPQLIATYTCVPNT